VVFSPCCETAESQIDSRLLQTSGNVIHPVMQPLPSDFSAKVRVIRLSPKLYAPKPLAVALPGGLHYLTKVGEKE